MYAENEPCTVKAIYVMPGQALSLQYHEHRAQRYITVDPIFLEWASEPVPIGLTDPAEVLRWYDGHKTTHLALFGEEHCFDKRVIHRAFNNSGALAMFFEVAYGTNDEADIVRLADRYGRGQA